jgi:non-ribosomal peptide synthase protein (TIGR01720 family)
MYIRDFRSRLPGKGRPYFAYSTLTSDGKEDFEKQRPIEILFNFLGKIEGTGASGLFEETHGGQSTKSDVGPNVPRFSLIEISAAVVNGIFQLSFGYNRHMKHASGIRNWARSCLSLLQNTTESLRHAETQLPRLTDFHLMPLAFGGPLKLAKEIRNLGLSIDDVENAYPSSHVQEGILISQAKDSGKYAYDSIFEIQPTHEGQRIDVQRLEAAWSRVVQRHASLRTVFIDSISGQGLKDQLVLRHAPPRILRSEASAANFRQVLADIQPLNYDDKVPPHRLAICRTGSTRLYARLEISHAICDGTSIEILLRGFSKAYEEGESFCTSGPLYSDIIGYLQASPKGTALSYWKDYLSGVEPCHFPALPDSSKPQKRSVGSYILTLDNAEELQALCLQEGLTPANVLQVVWGLVLRAYIGSNGVCFGYVASGRDAPVDGISEAVGALINILACRLSLSDDALVDDVLRRAQADWMQGMNHQSCSLAEVQHSLGLSATNLFNTAFTFQKRVSGDDIEDRALSFHFLDAADPNEFAVSLNIESTDQHLIAEFGYTTDTISDSQAQNIAKTFEHVLSDLVQGFRKDRTVGEISYFSEHSCQQVRLWNKSSPDVIERCVHELIEEQARFLPKSAVAVDGWDATFTYDQLMDMASRLGAHLVCQLGVGPETYIPVLFEKSAWVVVSYLAIMKAGAAFLPLDPTHPESRLENIIADVGANLVLCSSAYRDKAAKVADMTLTIDEGSMQALLDQRPAPQTRAVKASNPRGAAYVIMTSGSSGKPKPTVIEHGSICTSAIAHARALLMDNSSRVLQFASFTFDASITEILTALMVGARVCIPVRS